MKNKHIINLRLHCTKLNYSAKDMGNKLNTVDVRYFECCLIRTPLFRTFRYFECFFGPFA